MNDAATFNWSVADATRLDISMPYYGPGANTAVILADFMLAPETDAEKFQRLKVEWEEKTINLSSFDQMVAHPAYVAIIAMGKRAVPFLLAEIKTSPNHWFFALRKITGANPIPKTAAGNLRKMTEAWLKWGKKNGYPN